MCITHHARSHIMSVSEHLPHQHALRSFSWFSLVTQAQEQAQAQAQSQEKQIKQSLCLRRGRFYAETLNICYSPAGRSELGKTVPDVLDTARGRWPRAVSKTEGTVFPNTDRPSAGE